jgi:hypothetical protein
MEQDASPPMRRFCAFNGDADGLCALQQLRLAEGLGEPLELVSGPKRRTALVDGLEAGAGDALTVLDVSLDVNRAGVERLLARGVRVRYFDHHHAGEVPRHPLLEAWIDPSPGACTSLIVDRHLGGAHALWAVTGAFGDNLDASALRRAQPLALDAAELEALRRLGIALNYNAYGESEADLFFAPVALHQRLIAHADPRAFVREDGAFAVLWAGYQEDMARAFALAPHAESAHASLYLLPDASWARRACGVLANLLAREAPARAHALALPNGAGGMLVSVRAPLDSPTGAAALCRGYATGGGREAAAGINHLPASELERFARAFLQQFKR